MKVTWKKRFASALCAALLLGTMAGCGDQNAASSPSASNAPSPSASQSAPTGGSEDPVTIKVFSNLTDRTTGQGLIEQTLFDNYMDEHPNVTIEVEALDDESYKTKFKAYAAGSSMPDLVNIWCSPSFLDEVVEAGVLAKLNADDYTDYGFSEGSLDGVTYDGKLYGLPRNTDVLGFYYNKDLFAQYNLEVPTTWDELLTAAQTFQEAGIIPVAMDGQDKWPLAHFINCMVGTISGNDTYNIMLNSVKTGDYSDPVWNTVMTEAVEQAPVLFQTGFETTDYATAMNLFTNSQAAMFFMGSWEMSMSPDFEVGYFTMPDVDGDGEGVIGAYNGGGYAVSSSSQVKDAAIDLLNYMFLPENWSKLSWENGVCMSAQDFSAYLTGNETALQTDIINALNNASGITGMTYNDLGNSEYKTICEDSTVEVLSGMISIDDYFANLGSVIP